MNDLKLTRRAALTRAGWLAGAAAATGALSTAEADAADKSRRKEPPFRFCLNTGTLRGHKLGVVKEIEIAGRAGYDAIEPWMSSIQEYLQGGGTTAELRKRIVDAGLTLEDAISFPEWMAEDEAKRAKGMEQARREMDLLAQLGGRRYAAPPVGATGLPKVEITVAAERYRALLEAGAQVGIVPQFELWGFSKNFNRLGECLGLAMESGHPNACVLPDVFHLYKGGSEIQGLGMVGARAMPMLHMNDYPAEPARDKIDDSFRIFPGDGVAPLVETLRLLRQNGGQKVLSLELFNRKYWAEDPLQVAKAGLAKMKAVAQKALA